MRSPQGSNGSGGGWLHGIAAILAALLGAGGILGVIRSCSDTSPPITTASTSPAVTVVPPSTPPNLISIVSPPTPEPSPSVEPSEDVIKNAVTTAYINERNGFLTGDVLEFQKSYMGEALKSLEARLKGNAVGGASAILFNYDYSYSKFENYKVIENNKKVRIRATKRIKNIIFWRDRITCIGHQAGVDRTEDFELERTSAGWLISSSTIVAGEPEKIKDPPCPVDRL